MQPTAPAHGPAHDPLRPPGVAVNDVHSGLNRTHVERIVRVASTAEVQAAIRFAAARSRPVCAAGGWHAMGGQQFCSDGMLLDTRPLRARCELDRARGLLTVDAGMQWPELISRLLAMQAGEPGQWGIAQKQTGADRLSIGGAISANVHGRGLRMRPFLADVDSFTLVDADGEVRHCSRDENAELFRLAAGGYGLAGVITAATLRLAPRQKVERLVEIVHAEQLADGFDRRIAEGCLFGDLQFDIDPSSSGFLQRGVFACYRPVPGTTPVTEGSHVLDERDWRRLLHLAHFDKASAWRVYTEHYLRTAGQVYWSDTHQMSIYPEGYHAELDAACGSPHACSEMITEIFVPRPEIAGFLAEAAEDFRVHDVDCIYGTVRLIERDDESLLAWAREPWACTIFNLHVPHTRAGIFRAAEAFRRLIDMAVRRRGSYYLTYHRWATREQVMACHPAFPAFLESKSRVDPAGRFQSDWYRHHVRLFT